MIFQKINFIKLLCLASAFAFFSPNQAIAGKSKLKIDKNQTKIDSFYTKKRVDTGQINPPQNVQKKQILLQPKAPQPEAKFDFTPEVQKKDIRPAANVKNDTQNPVEHQVIRMTSNGLSSSSHLLPPVEHHPKGPGFDSLVKTFSGEQFGIQVYSVSQKPLSSTSAPKVSNIKRPSSLDRTVDAYPTKALKVKKESSPSSFAAHSTIRIMNKEPSVLGSGHSSIPQRQKQSIGTKFERVFGNEDHIAELVSLIDSSKKKLEIFSWTLGYLASSVFDALREASDRGVEIILTVQEVKREETQDALEEVGVQINSDRKTHTKFVMVDSDKAMIGSYNFLGASNDDNDDNDEMGESSFKISENSELVARLRGRIYRDMICCEKKEPPLVSPLCIDLPNNSRFYLLTNLFHHQEFLKSMAQNAQERVIIYSPFVNYRNALAQLKILEERVSANVSLVFHTRPDQAQQLSWALNQCPKLKARTTIKDSDFHRKSFIIDPLSPDGCHFCDGSFNWFSAATDINNEACNQETSVVLSGRIARNHLQADEIDY